MAWNDHVHIGDIIRADKINDIIDAIGANTVAIEDAEVSIGAQLEGMDTKFGMLMSGFAHPTVYYPLYKVYTDDLNMWVARDSSSNIRIFDAHKGTAEIFPGTNSTSFFGFVGGDVFFTDVNENLKQKKPDGTIIAISGYGSNSSNWAYNAGSFYKVTRTGSGPYGGYVERYTLSGSVLSLYETIQLNGGATFSTNPNCMYMIAVDDRYIIVQDNSWGEHVFDRDTGSKINGATFMHSYTHIPNIGDKIWCLSKYDLTYDLYPLMMRI